MNAISLSVLTAQLPVSLDIFENLRQIEDVLGQAEPQDLVVLPEGIASGYSEDISFLERIDQAQLNQALETLKQVARVKQIHLAFGSCIFQEDKWYNAGIYYGPQGESNVYRKINLAEHERGVITAGSSLSVIAMHIADQTVHVGIQLCREIRFPEQWQALARQGAQVFVYLTNAVGDSDMYPVWKSHLISRAAENQRFVLSANVAEPAQKCPSAIVSPKGQVLWEADSYQPQWHRATIELSQVSDWYLSQSRRDVIE